MQLALARNANTDSSARRRRRPINFLLIAPHRRRRRRRCRRCRRHGDSTKRRSFSRPGPPRSASVAPLREPPFIAGEFVALFREGKRSRSFPRLTRVHPVSLFNIFLDHKPSTNLFLFPLLGCYDNLFNLWVTFLIVYQSLARNSVSALRPRRLTRLKLASHSLLVSFDSLQPESFGSRLWRTIVNARVQLRSNRPLDISRGRRVVRGAPSSLLIAGP